MTPPSYTAAEVDAAVEALSDPERMARAQAVVVHAAPSLGRVLAAALREGGFYEEAHDTGLRRALAPDAPAEREAAVSSLLDEEVHLGMLVGVTVGFALAHELQAARKAGADEPSPAARPPSSSTPPTERETP